jgi:hypothetical protein
MFLSATSRRIVAADQRGPGRTAATVERSRTERMIALLHAQRLEATRRSGEVRGTQSWAESSARLDALNDQIMHVGADGATQRETLGIGLELDLDSRPVEDTGFRRSVIESMRRAVVVATEDRLAALPPDRLTTATERMTRTHELIRRAQADVRGGYPDAELDADVTDRAPDPGLVSVRADRDGRAA